MLVILGSDRHVCCQWCIDRQEVEIYSLTILDDPDGSSGMTGRYRS